MIESASIARGFVIADAMLKRAEVAILWSRPVTPGKYVVIVGGDEASVAEAMRAGTEAAGDTEIDRLYLAGAHPQLGPAIAGQVVGGPITSLGIIEAATVASTLLAADVACKAAQVTLHDLGLARGIGGKGFFSLTGLLDDIQAALSAIERALDPKHLLAREIIANPHDDWAGCLVR